MVSPILRACWRINSRGNKTPSGAIARAFINSAMWEGAKSQRQKATRGKSTRSTPKKSPVWRLPLKRVKASYFPTRTAASTSSALRYSVTGRKSHRGPTSSSAVLPLEVSPPLPPNSPKAPPVESLNCPNSTTRISDPIW